MLGMISLDVKSHLIVPCRHGTFCVYVNDMIGRMLFEYGEWAEQEVQFLSRIVRPGDTVLDIGAHVGTITVPLAKIIGSSGRLFAFEAQRLLYYNLCTNIHLNELTNVFSIHAAVSNSSGYLNLLERHLADAKNSGAFSIPLDGNSPQSELHTPKIMLDEFLQSTPSCRLVKMDIEGYEPAALRGMMRFVQRTKPILYIEANTAKRFELISSVIQAMNYRAFWHTEPHWNPTNFRGNKHNHYGSKTDVNVVCYPDDWYEPMPDGREAKDFSEVADFAANSA